MRVQITIKFVHKFKFSVELDSSSLIKDTVVEIEGEVSWSNSSKVISNEKAVIRAFYNNEEVISAIESFSKFKDKPYEVKEYPIQLGFKKNPLGLSLILKLSANGYIDMTVDSGIYNGHLFTGEKLKLINK